MTTTKLGLVTLLLVLAVATLSAGCRHQEGFREDQRRQCEDYFRDKRSREGDELEGREEEAERSPYVFQDRHFDTVVRSEEGRIQLLKRFAERSKLLKGIDNYRLGFIEANPRAFIAPVHFDADTLFFLASGRATVTLLKKDGRKAFNLEIGDVLFVPAGTPVYAVNRDEREKLVIVNFINPVSLPGHVELFHFTGSEDKGSFYKAFSWKVLGAAFKREKEEIERLLRQQKQGPFSKASREQVEELGRHAKTAGGEGVAPVWPFHSESGGTDFNLFKLNVHSNRYGRLFETNLDKFDQLKELDLIISFANITRGSMAGPIFNSKATKISFIVEGDGWLEMASPHVSALGEPQQEGRGGGFHQVTGQLHKGTVFVAPAGFPVALVASPNSNLQVLCFEVFAKGNVRYPLAGKNNVVSEMDNVAKELSFGAPAREVDRIFGSQNEELFFPGPTQQPEEEVRGGGGRREYV